MKFPFRLLNLLLISAAFIFTACSDDDPVKEDVPEVVTKITLTFTPTSGSPVVVTASDPDGDGAQSLAVDGPINLDKDVSYTLSIEMINGLYNPNEEGYNITEEVEEEGAEHQFYYSWSDGVFSNPAGDGNIDNRAHAVNYKDTDDNGLPIGLVTEWKASPNSAYGKTFRVLLKHQPDIKTATSTSEDGETDVDVQFVINVD